MFEDLESFLTDNEVLIKKISGWLILFLLAVSIIIIFWKGIVVWLACLLLLGLGLVVLCVFGVVLYYLIKVVNLAISWIKGA